MTPEQLRAIKSRDDLDAHAAIDRHNLHIYVDQLLAVVAAADALIPVAEDLAELMGTDQEGDPARGVLVSVGAYRAARKQLEVP